MQHRIQLQSPPPPRKLKVHLTPNHLARPLFFSLFFSIYLSLSKFGGEPRLNKAEGGALATTEAYTHFA